MASVLMVVLSIMSVSISLPLLVTTVHLHSLHEIRMHSWMWCHTERWRWHMTVLLVVSLQLHGMHATSIECLLLHGHLRKMLLCFFTYLLFVFGFAFLIILTQIFFLVWVPLALLLVLLGVLLRQFDIFWNHGWVNWRLGNLTLKKFQILRVLGIERKGVLWGCWHLLHFLGDWSWCAGVNWLGWVVHHTTLTQRPLRTIAITKVMRVLSHVSRREEWVHEVLIRSSSLRLRLLRVTWEASMWSVWVLKMLIFHASFTMHEWIIDSGVYLTCAIFLICKPEHIHHVHILR